MKRWCVALVLAMLSCKSGDKPAEQESSGVQECDEYVAALQACVAKIPEAERGPMEQQLRTEKETLAKADAATKKQMRDRCRTGRATVQADPRCK